MEAEKHYKKGLWTEEEDRLLLEYINVHGRGHWNSIAKITGLKRCGKSCRLRWLNYLSPNVKHGDFSMEEEDLIIRLHNLLGNRWSLIAGRVPGRTDNQVKNHWNTHLRKKLGIKKQNRKTLNSLKNKQTLSSSSTQVEERLKKDNSKSNISMEVNQHTTNENYVFNGGDYDDATWMSHNWIESFISNDDLNLNSPSLADLLNGYST